MINPHLKQAMQNMLSEKFKIGQRIEFYEKLTPGFKGKYTDTTQSGTVTEVKHPFVVVLAEDGKIHHLYSNEIK